MCDKCKINQEIAHLDMIICVGFGAAYVEKDDKLIYDGENDFQQGNEPKTVQHFEDMAKKEPNHDYKIIIEGPLSGATYQRQGENLWVCIESNEGFA